MTHQLVKVEVRRVDLTLRATFWGGSIGNDNHRERIR